MAISIDIDSWASLKVTWSDAVKKTLASVVKLIM